MTDDYGFETIQASGQLVETDYSLNEITLVNIKKSNKVLQGHLPAKRWHAQMFGIWNIGMCQKIQDTFFRA